MSETNPLAKTSLPAMPKWNWKSALKFGVQSSEKKKPTTTQKDNKNLVATHQVKPRKEIKRTPLKKVWARKKKRIAEYGTESDFFFKVWEEAGWLDSPVICSCGCTELVKHPFVQDAETGKWKLVKPQCFAHILSKGMYEKFRYLRENIGIVATSDCHKRQDERYNDRVVRNHKEAKFDLILKNL
jgi:hypothetical protein